MTPILPGGHKGDAEAPGASEDKGFSAGDGPIGAKRADGPLRIACGNGILMVFWQETMAAMWRSSVLRHDVLNPLDVHCRHKMVVTGN